MAPEYNSYMSRAYAREWRHAKDPNNASEGTSESDSEVESDEFEDVDPEQSEEDNS